MLVHSVQKKKKKKKVLIDIWRTGKENMLPCFHSQLLSFVQSKCFIHPKINMAVQKLKLIASLRHLKC